MEGINVNLGNLNIIQDDEEGEFSRGRRGRGAYQRNQRGRRNGRGHRRASRSSDTSHSFERGPSQPRFQLVVYGEDGNDDFSNEKSDDISCSNDEKGAYYNRGRQSDRGNRTRGRRGFQRRHSTDHSSQSHRGFGDPGRGRGRGKDVAVIQRAIPVENVPEKPRGDRTRIFGFRKLSELNASDKSPDVLLMELNTSRNGFRELIRDENLSTKSDWMVMILNVLARAFISTQRQSVMELLTAITEEKFLQVNLTPYLNEVLSNNVSLSGERLFSLLSNVCLLVTEILKRTQINISAMNLLITVLDAIISDGRRHFPPDLLKQIEDVKSMKEAIQEKREEMKEFTSRTAGVKVKTSIDCQPPEDFRSLQILPSFKDLQFFEKPFLRANKIDGGYDNLTHYLDVQFRLLREDYVRPLREGIAEYRRQRAQGVLSRKFSDIRLYEKVQIIRPMCTHRGVLHMIQFDASKMKGVRWESSRRLLFGSLLCLSFDDFETILFATVTNRDVKELSQGLLQVQFEKNTEISTKDKYIMAETTAYFEAYRHILEGLQETPNDMPLQKYIVKCGTTQKPPKYLLRGVITYDFAPLRKDNLTLHVPVINTLKWPSARQLDLDESQHRALQMAITKEFAIIQGPPGTGKTFVGWKIVHLLLHNKTQWSETTTDPILVVCYTNHALDQFLSEIADFTDRIIRIGGRCAADKLEPFMLKNYRKKARETRSVSKIVHERKSDCLKKMAVCRDSIETVSAKLHAARSGILKKEILEKYMTPEQNKSLASKFQGSDVKKGNQIFIWLELFTGPEPVKDRLFESYPPIFLQWREELLEGEKIDPMTETDAKEVDDPWKLALQERAALYKYWLKIFRTNLSFEIAKESNTYQEMSGSLSTLDETKLIRIRERIANLDLKLRKCRSMLLHQNDLLSFLPKNLHRNVTDIIKKCPQSFPSVSSIDIWLCLEMTKQNEELLSQTIMQLNEDFVDVEEEALAEDRERRLNDDDDGDDEMEYMARHTKRTNTQIVQETLSDMCFSSTIDAQGPNSDSKWQTVEMPKKKLASEMKSVLNIDKPLLADEASNIYDVWILPRGERLRLYRFWMDSYLNELRDSVAETENIYEDLCKAYKEAMDAEDVEIMAGAEIIGMTTTGAAKFRAIIQQIKPKIIIVEEAAEVLESHIITTINPNCQHLILIGDHKQLRPTPTVYDLASKYNLEISLFERMVKNEMNYTTLQNQHRMRPAISMLMKHIYPDLKDHANVLTYDHVKGVARDVFLINHEQQETSNEETKSKSNLHEAKFMARFCQYLLQQGYDPSQITLLTTYTGQVLLLKKQMPKKDFEGIKITAVDNFQGEENDIVLLSLVRSNKVNNIGFLKIENRICVALSRARMGFYIIGNFGLLAKESNLWENMVYTMVQQKCVGSKLILRCQNHPTEETPVSKEEDFSAVPNGGCKRMCNARLPCGHVCEQVCHPEDREHKFYKCFKPCEKIVCASGHKCSKKCFAQCGPCMTTIRKIIPSCSHEHTMPCSQDPSTFDCISPCDQTLNCGHVCKGKCGLCRRNPGHVPCGEKCIKTLSCQHEIETKCSVPIERIKCTFKCRTKLMCGHECTGTCFTCFGGKLHMSCQMKCGRPLFCGHTCSQSCSEPCPPCKKNCASRCSHSHCKKKCGEVCDDCVEPCNWSCIHQKCELKCTEKCNRPPCFTSCPKKISCGCQCSGFCGEKCPQLCPKCNKSEFQKVTSHVINKSLVRLVALEDCNDVFEASFFDDYMSVEGTQDSTSCPVEAKKCPKCSTLITKSRRYCGILRSISTDINTVKKCLEVDVKESSRRKSKLIKEIELLRQKDEDAANDLAKKPEIKTVDGIASTESLDLLENQIHIIQEVFDIFSFVKQTKLDSSVEKDIANSLMRIRDWTIREHFLPSKKSELISRWRRRFTQQEIEELMNEFCRLRYVINVFVLNKEKKKISQSLLICLAEAVKRLQQKFTSEQEIHMSDMLKQVARFVPQMRLIPVTKVKLIITKGVNEGGKWYKCLRGHIGQVLGEKRKCHGCHLMVGPDSHTPRVHYPPDPVSIDDSIPSFNEEDIAESLTKNDTDSTVWQPAIPAATSQAQERISDSKSKRIRNPSGDKMSISTDSTTTLQPGIIITSVQHTVANSALRTSETKSEQSGKAVQPNKRYVFKCSNGHHCTYAISEIPHSCPQCPSMLFTQVGEQVDEVALAQEDSKDTRNKESVGEEKKTRGEFSLAVRCQAGHVMHRDAVVCQICDTANRRKFHEEREINQISFKDKERESAELSTENLKNMCPKGHILRSEQTECRLCRYLTKKSNYSSESSDSNLVGGIPHESFRGITLERDIKETQTDDAKLFHSDTKQLDSENTEGDKHIKQSKSNPLPGPPKMMKCQKGHVMLRNETECSWCMRMQDIVGTQAETALKVPSRPYVNQNQEDDDKSSAV